MPPNELEIANFPQSEKVTEVGTLADTSSHNETADKLSIQQEDATQLNFVSQLSDIVSGCIGMIEETAVPCPYAKLIVGTRHCRLLYIIPAQPELI